MLIKERYLSHAYYLNHHHVYRFDVLDMGIFSKFFFNFLSALPHCNIQCIRVHCPGNLEYWVDFNIKQYLLVSYSIKPANNLYYHSLYSILDFDWLIYLQITACKYRSAAKNWCKYFIEHAHFVNASSASLKKISFFQNVNMAHFAEFQKAHCPLY